MGTIRGNLVRALLIQVQKTKVDVELAVNGIDALLKSQELVFGYTLFVLNNFTNATILTRTTDLWAWLPESWFLSL